MKQRAVFTSLAVLVAVGCASPVAIPESEILIAGHVTKQEWTGELMDCGEDCIAWTVPYIFKIKVGKVWSGTLGKSAITGVRWQHIALNTELPMPWLFVLRPMTNSENTAYPDADYWIEDVAIPFSVSCFSKAHDGLRDNGDIEAEEISELSDTDFGHQCFFTDSLEQIEDGT